MFRREMGSKRSTLSPKEGDLTCMTFLGRDRITIARHRNISEIHVRRANV